jgi:hypothetical protein
MAKAEYTVLGTSIPRMGGVERVHRQIYAGEK